MPETLDEVKAGDTVIAQLGRAQYTCPQRKIVDRVTPTQIVIETRRFSKSDGLERAAVGYWETRGQIFVGDAARKHVAAWERRYKKDFDVRRFEATKPRYNQKSIMEVRSACDVAEAGLRELGEWHDAPTSDAAHEASEDTTP